MRKELLLFSLPLFVSIFLSQLMHWTDVLMLGYYTTAERVGVYSGGITLARSITLLLGAGGYMFIPIFSALYGQKKLIEMRRSYVIITKWIFSATLPLFFILFVFPRITLNFLLGGAYDEASTALRILALGFIFHVVVGLNGMTLIAVGKIKFFTIATMTALISNITLNMLLIPLLGINGAAISTAASYILINAFMSIVIFKVTKIHPFSGNYLKPLLISGSLITGLILIFTFVIAPSLWWLLLLLLLFILTYFFGLLVTRSIDQEDISMLLTIEKMAGINMSSVKRLLKRFI
jgi:O-antigen/teichoic acid export membrane protein